MFGADDVEYLTPGRLGADANTLTPGVFSSPEDLLNAATQANNVVLALHAAIDANRKSKRPTVPTNVKNEWIPFAVGWSNYFTTNFGGRLRTLAHWFTSDMQGSLRNYQAQISDWTKKLSKYGIGISGATTEGEKSNAASVMMWIGIGVVTLAGLYIIGKAVHKVTLGNAALTEAEETAMRIVDEKQRKKRDKTAFSIS